MKRRYLFVFLAALVCAADQAPAVTVRQPVARETAEYEFAGRVEPVEEVAVRAQIGGTIEKVRCKAGDDVNKGDLLFELNAEPLKHALEEAATRVKPKEKAVAEAAKKLDKLQKDKAKEVDIEKARAEQQLAEVILDLARAEVDRARDNLELTRIKAPLAGRVVKIENVGKGTATTLCTLARTDQVAVSFVVDERSWLHLEEMVLESKGKISSVTGLPVVLALPGDKGLPHSGTVDAVDNQLDPKTASIRFRAVFPNKDGKLTDAALAPDDKKATARVRLKVGQPRKVLLVPPAVVSGDAGGDKHILVVNNNNVVESRRVKLGAMLEGMQVVDEGLKADDWVIVNVEQARRDPGDKTLSPNDFVKDLRTFGLKPGTTVAPVRVASEK
jgi:RND family efflux transporter MFP subunit